MKMTVLERRYENEAINRQYWLSDAMIRLKSYQWGLIDNVATTLTDDEVAAFCKIVSALNEASSR